MAEYRTCECYACHVLVPKPEARRLSIEKESGRSGGSVRLGKNSASYSTGRMYYRKQDVWLCTTCYSEYAAQQSAQHRKRLIIGGVVAVGAGVWLINSGWSPSQSHQAASYETPTATAEFARVVESTKASALSEKDDVTAMQVRLADLGYLSAAPTGTIGPKTRAALRSFKAANGLPVDELYDNTTKSRLFAKNAVRVPGPLAVVANTQSPATQRMLKLSETDRNNSWTRLLQGSGERCDAASRSMYEGGRKDTGDFWSVACTDGRSYRISVAYDASGSTKIVSCSVLKAVGSECFKKL